MEKEKLLDAVKPAVSGQGGHDATFGAFCYFRKHCRTEKEWEELCSEYNTKKCSPPWNKVELEHKIKDARAREKLGDYRTRMERDGYVQRPAPSILPVIRNPAPTPLPPSCGTATDFLRHVFREGELVCICNGDNIKTDEGGGVAKSREQWISDLEGKTLTSQGGYYVRVNPLRSAEGKRDDKNVADFRHLLVEMDRLELEKQLTVLNQLSLPIVSLHYSGGKSIHAWVAVNAADSEEYASVVAEVYGLLAPYKIDPANKNPSRYSRLPGTYRGNIEQTLFGLYSPDKTAKDWIMEKKYSPTSLLQMKTPPENAPDEIIKFRFWNKHRPLFIIGQPGIGKSSFGVQLAVHMCLGIDCLDFLINPLRRRIVVLQKEDDEADMSQVKEGVLNHMDLSEEELDWIDSNLLFLRCREDFLIAGPQICDYYKPDIILLNPLTSFYEGELNCNSEVGRWTNAVDNTITHPYGVGLMVVHHCPKIRKDATGEIDPVFSGLGAQRWAAWPMANIVLKPTKQNDKIQVIIGKRKDQLCWGDSLLVAQKSDPDTGWYWTKPSASEAISDIVFTMNADKKKQQLLEYLPKKSSEQGKTVTELARHMGCSDRTAKRMLEEYGLKECFRRVGRVNLYYKPEEAASPTDFKEQCFNSNN